MHSVRAHSLTDLVVRPPPVSAAAAVGSLQVCTVLCSLAWEGSAHSLLVGSICFPSSVSVKSLLCNSTWCQPLAEESTERETATGFCDLTMEAESSPCCVPCLGGSGEVGPTLSPLWEAFSLDLLTEKVGLIFIKRST